MSTYRLEINEDFVASKIADYKIKISDLINQEDIQRLEIDFANVEIIDSIGIGTLVSSNAQIRKKNGEIVLVNLSNEIFEIFETMNLVSFFTIVKKK